MEERPGGSPWLWVRIALVVFVLGWILGPSTLRDSVPIVLVFAIALGLELHFFVSALRGGSVRQPNRLPQEIDRERYGFDFDRERYGFDLDADDAVDGVASDGLEQDELEREDFEQDEHEQEAPERGAWLDANEEDDLVHEPAPRPVTAPLRRFALGLGVIAALGALAWYADSRTGWSALPGSTKAAAVDRFSRAASSIAGKPVSIRCDESRDYVGAVQHADGVAIVGGDLAILTPEICDDLYRLAFREETTGSRTGRALAVLAHESWHLRGVGNEGVTECYALQSGVELGVRLGLSAGRARQLMREQLIENQLRGPDTLEYLVPSECRDGGRLDLHPASGRFP